ncbi:nitroreductase family deazaflavin-dependent oxidoreductase [Nocardia transvalensis]|nr:nitroreductase family deazaflavin-dependent oxidoreductase [Nocardia transvalensis]
MEQYQEEGGVEIAGQHDGIAILGESHLGAALVLLHTVGRRSGKLRKVALPFWRDADGHRIVGASFAGASKHPAWSVTSPIAAPIRSCWCARVR